MYTDLIDIDKGTRLTCCGCLWEELYFDRLTRGAYLWTWFRHNGDGLYPYYRDTRVIRIYWGITSPHNDTTGTRRITCGYFAEKNNLYTLIGGSGIYGMDLSRSSKDSTMDSQSVATMGFAFSVMSRGYYRGTRHFSFIISILYTHPQPPRRYIMILIGINGKIGSGKSTAADYLADYCSRNHLCQVHRISFATALKDIAMTFLGLTRDDCYTQEGKAKFNECWGMTNREILQRIGTDAFRNGFHPDTWVKIVELKITEFEKANRDPQDVIIVDDVRFPNEAEMIRKHGGKVFAIVRPANSIKNVGIQEHASEQMLPIKFITHEIINSGTIEELKHKVKAAASAYKLFTTLR